MKVLVIGSGAREHALVWKISKSKRVSKIFCAPGNAGIENLAECVNIKSEDIEMLLNFAMQEKIDLTIVGPEAPLVDGIVDVFKENNLLIFGPEKNGALLEGSKCYAKDFMNKYNIPTAKYKTLSSAKEALDSLSEFSYPLVIKADGLAAGKGVVICENEEEANKTIIDMMENKSFGSAGNDIVLEEFLYGTELSLICLVGNNNIVPLESARDYKKALDNDEGLNTGGMGCFSPNPELNNELNEIINKEVLENIKIGFKKENIDFYGVLFIGIIITQEGPKVLEFNVRFGDPETEVIIPRLESDIIDIFLKTLDGKLTSEDLVWKKENSLTVIIASGGYPLAYEKNKKITGLNSLDEDIIVFHGGTKSSEDGVYSNGGRVLAVTTLGNTLNECREKVYKNIENINFENMYYRKDIGKI